MFGIGAGNPLMDVSGVAPIQPVVSGKWVGQHIRCSKSRTMPRRRLEGSTTESSE